MNLITAHGAPPAPIGQGRIIRKMRFHLKAYLPVLFPGLKYMVYYLFMGRHPGGPDRERGVSLEPQPLLPGPKPAPRIQWVMEAAPWDGGSDTPMGMRLLRGRFRILGAVGDTQALFRLRTPKRPPFPRPPGDGVELRAATT